MFDSFKGKKEMRQKIDETTSPHRHYFTFMFKEFSLHGFCIHVALTLQSPGLYSLNFSSLASTGEFQLKSLIKMSVREV